MLDAIEKSREELDSAIANLQGKLEPLMRDIDRPVAGNDTSEKQPQSELMRILDSLNEKLREMTGTVEMISDRLDIP